MSKSSTGRNWLSWILWISCCSFINSSLIHLKLETGCIAKYLCMWRISPLRKSFLFCGGGLLFIYFWFLKRRWFLSWIRWDCYSTDTVFDLLGCKWKDQAQFFVREKPHTLLIDKVNLCGSKHFWYMCMYICFFFPLNTKLITLVCQRNGDDFLVFINLCLQFTDIPPLLFPPCIWLYMDINHIILKHLVLEVYLR